MLHGRREAETALDESQNRYRELVENANSIILRMAPTGVITYLNRFGLKFFGYSQDELIGHNAVGRIVPDTDMAGRDLAAMIADIARNPERYVNNENENTYRDGSRVWISWTNKAIYDDSGRLVEVLCIGNDLSERKEAEEKLEQALREVRELSLVDQLTGLKNRRGFLTLAEQQLKVADRTQVGVRLVFIDLDNMKQINDNLGHNVGDQALVEAADVLRETFRESDIIARLDGDEFAVLLIHTSPDVPFSAERLAETLEAHNAREDRAYELRMSVGVAVYDRQSQCTIEELLSRADDLMYAEKRRRKASDEPSSPDTYPAEACER
jgi:diguanylate cyclase (GGDEF)-like protein/PAS domain S-box-containing protein